jgi:hypothetical protein
MEVLYQLSYSPAQNASRTYHRNSRGTIGFLVTLVLRGNQPVPGSVQEP